MTSDPLSETPDFDTITPVNKELNPMSDDIQETPSSTPNFKIELAKKLEELVPEAIADGKVDVAKLKELLGDDVDDDSERFGLFWPGKLRAIRAAQEPTTATLTPEPELSKDWDTTGNVFIEGDNLEALKILQKYYHGKIKMIYIDPPYNTGKDFVYPDNYKEGLKTYLEWTKQVNENGQKVKSNTETDGRYHSHWLNMMYPRLKLARSLLTDDGVIFISIDDNEYTHLKKLCDEVFGEMNYVNTFVWVSNLKGRQISSFGAAATKEYVLCYARQSALTREFTGSIRHLKTLMPGAYKGFNYQTQYDDRGAYVIKNELYNTNSAFNEVTRPNLVFDIYYNPQTKDVKTAKLSVRHLYPDYVKISPKTNNNGINKYHAYRWSAKKIEAESYDLAFIETLNGWKVYTKVRNVDSVVLKDILTDINTTQGSSDIKKIGCEPKWFDYPKPVNLLQIFLEAVTEKESLVLDFFSGSSTTAHAVMQLNAEDGGSRRHIQVQLPEPVDPDSPAGKAGFKTIADIARKRIDLAGEKIKQDYAEQLAKRETPLDVGYRTYKLTDTNFAKWRESSAVDQGTLEQHLLDLRDSANDDATELALLTEVLLKQGYSLSEQVQKQTIAGLEVWSIGEHNLALAYMNERVKPTLEQLRALVDREPERLIILEDAFQGDDELKTNLVQAAKTKRVELWAA